MTTPVIKLIDFGVSTAVFKWERDGKKSYSVSLQRSYKKKDSDEYVNETINLYPEDLLKYAHLLEKTYDAYNDYAYGSSKKQASAPTAAPASAPAATPSSASVDDDIPFN